LLSPLHKAWRLLPEGARRAAMTQVAAVLAPRRRKPPAVSYGAVIAGDNEGRHGIAESGRILRRALAQLKMDRGAFPLGLPLMVPRFTGNLPLRAAVIAVVNAPFLPIALARLPRKLLRKRRIIGVWAWELPVVPNSWRQGAKFVHEVWAPSQFCADAFEAVAPGRVKVVPFPLAALPPPPIEGNRASFGLPEGVFVVLCAFNLASSFVRKNPLGAIAAFRAAFAENAETLLVVKISNVEEYAQDLAAIRQAAGGARNIRIMADDLSEPELQGLLAASDVILSLHRAEGFGLILAAGVLLGKPVVATGWSGNLTFMDAASSPLVNYRLVPAIDPRGVYAVKDAQWAEPDIEDAASWLRRLFEDTELRTRLGEEGKAFAEHALSMAPLAAALRASKIF
jgi:glycosyltransferase involved in cell wall biosynthesis